MNSLRAAWRLGRAIAHAFAGLAIVVFLFPRWSEPRRHARVQSWSLEMLSVMGIRLQLRGTPPANGPVLLVANHISWVDILVMHAARHCRFVSKAEVRHWPVIGPMASAAGTLYIERASRRDAMRVVHHMAASLQRGEIVAAFPEGTTSDGLSLLPFHANLLQAAITANAPAQPVALSFIDTMTGRPSLSPCYVGDDTLVSSVWRTLSGPPLTAVVHYGEREMPQGRGRREWAADLRRAVDELRRAEPIASARPGRQPR